MDTPQKVNQPGLRPITAVTFEDLKREMVRDGRKPFVAKQIMQGIYTQNAQAFDEITNLSLEVRRDLASRYALRTLQVERKLVSPDGTFKLVLRLPDGNLIECAYLAEVERSQETRVEHVVRDTTRGTGRVVRGGQRTAARRGEEADGEAGDGSLLGGTACISTQVGCGMGCVFCASGAKGFVRNLAPFEMLEQVMLIRDQLGQDRRLTNVTCMGIGEPLANLDHLLTALDQVNSPEGLNIGARKICVSTCGLPEAIRKLADHGKQFHLAISLHSPNDELRRLIMPEAAKIPINLIMRAAEYYCKKTTRKVAIEYILIQHLNDDTKHAEQLVALLGRFPSMVNLIPFNAVSCRPDLQPASRTQASRFLKILQNAGLDACIRRRRGAELHAACGQLRLNAMTEEEGGGEWHAAEEGEGADGGADDGGDEEE